MLKCFIGFDPRQTVSYTVLSHSISVRSSVPVSITPLIIEQLPISRVGLTPFTYSRFLVPWLCDYKGWALFLDADILLNDDISKLFELADDKYSVMVSKNQVRFEWASVMLFNCEKCQVLTPEYVEKAEKLHAISFVDEKEVGELPSHWNHLVGYDKPCDNPSLIHYTQGVPAWPETENCEHGELWRVDGMRAVSARSWAELMGNSVHAVVNDEGRLIPRYKQQRVVDEKTASIR